MSTPLDVAARAANLFRAHLTLSEAELRRITPYLRPYRAASGTTLFRAGDLCRHVLLMSRGLVRVFYLHEDREVNLRLLCAPSAVVAFSSFVRGAPSDETVEALEDVEGVMMRLTDFRDAHPGETAERLRRVLAEQHYLAMERRLRNLQWRSARERWRFFTAHMEPDIVARVPGFHVASYLGVRPESLSRVRRAPTTRARS
jgi:CRP-like cAMP-binding protein